MSDIGPLVPALRARLLSLPPVVALVGDRIYVLTVPQSAELPGIRLLEVSRVRRAHLRGRTDLAMARVQIDSFARWGAAGAYRLAHDIAAAVAGGFVGGAAEGLVGFRGELEGLEIAAIVALDQTERLEPMGSGEVARVISEFLVWFKG